MNRTAGAAAQMFSTPWKTLHPARAGFSTLWKNRAFFSTPWKTFFHTVEKSRRAAPIFSTQWEKFARFFHTMEKLWAKSSTLWKNLARLPFIFPHRGKSRPRGINFFPQCGKVRGMG
jgi:hypothetical protein